MTNTAQKKSFTNKKKTLFDLTSPVSKSDNEVNEANYVLKYKPIRRNVYDLDIVITYSSRKSRKTLCREQFSFFSDCTAFRLSETTIYLLVTRALRRRQFFVSIFCLSFLQLVHVCRS